MTTRDEISDSNNKVSWWNGIKEELIADFNYNSLPETFEAIILSGVPEQSNDWQGTTTVSEATIAEKNDSRYYFVRVRPLGIQDLIIPDPFTAKDLPTAKRLINSHPIAHAEVNNTVHPPTHGDIFLCRYTRKDKLGIALLERLRRSAKKINAVSNQALHTAFNSDKNPGLMSNYSQGTAVQAAGGSVPAPANTSKGLADQTPVVTAGQYGQPEKTAPDNGMACSVLVAIWVLNQMNKRPPKDKWPLWQSWASLDKALWRKAQITGKEADGSKVKDGSIINIKAYQEKLGGSYVQYSREQTRTSQPVLTSGRWHIIQSWTPNKESPEEYITGHSYLIHYSGGDTVRKIDSSHKNKYKDRNVKVTSWYPKGSEVTVLTLPF